MAYYLWVGQEPGSTASVTEHVDKYNFNIAKNWLKEVGNAWVVNGATGTVPFGGDSVRFGFGNDPTRGISRAGWTHAKSPCLFGGYSGGVGAGAWGLTGIASNLSGDGNTFTNSLFDVMITDVGYNFPYLGGGISGDILNWCAYRDGLGATAYTSQNTRGYRNPSSNLRLKVKNYIDSRYRKNIQASNYDEVGTPELHTGTTKFIFDVEPVKALSFITGTGGNPSSSVVTTKFYAENHFGGGVRLRGGYFEQIDVNRSYVGPWVQHPNAPYAYNPQNSTSHFHDCGVELYDVCMNKLNLTKEQSTNVVRGIAGNISVYQFPYLYGTEYVQSGGNLIPYQVVLDEVPVTISADMSTSSIASLWNDLYGITGALADGIPYSTLGNLVLDIFSSFTNNWNTPPIEESLYLSKTSSIMGRTGPEQERRQNVVLGDTDVTRTITIPKITIISDAPMSGSYSIQHQYMPWSVEFCGNVNVTTLKNIGGYVYSAESVPLGAQVKVGQCYISRVGMVDFSKIDPYFDDWKFGGISGGGASTIVNGGIIFEDNTARIRGSGGMRLWNTDTSNGYNFRSTSTTKVTDLSESQIPNQAV